MGLLDKLLKAQKPKRNLMGTQMAKGPDQPYLRQDYPTLYGALGGLLGTAPDVMEGSVMDPNTAAVRQAAEYTFPVGTALAMLPAARFTKGLPVGMGIKDVGKNIFEDAIKYHQKIPEIKSINVNNLKRMNAGEVADVSDEVAAKMDFSKPIQVSVFSDGELRIVDGHHRVAAAKKLGIQSLPVELQAINAKGSTLNKLAQESPYPQQAALDLAQQRAALPVEQGGLGLLRSNTAEQRAKAMGFDMETYHGTNAPDIRSIDVNKSRSDVQYMPGFFTADNPNLAQNYGDIVMPLLQKKGTTILDRRAARQSGQEVPMLDTVYDKEKGILVTNNPENIRSRFAAFDPFRKTAAIAATMGVAAPDLLASPIDEEELRRLQSGLLYAP